MKTAVINLKIDSELKKDVQKIAEDLGFSLSAIISSQLKQLVKTRTFTVDAKPLKPTPYLKKILREAEEDEKKGFVSPTFDNVDDAIAWLDDPDAKYINQI
ncbi:hypothetical protein A2690_02825 [Candidatus Roizmanbacteria bacterium RIFCSPHIGHO2_01_FULL_39_12b]|uniref:Uncharacterized protein n=1 Tax=Candidatus Roizmanbacteria bacterium RIFCSPHIGHO2_01_FULL_39_12b TaxID=1802030 RepID=A0A1F7GBI3_9BACT|nr:MAG: hypothetical protein A2690_02825 [Candidatus Roizmanbacteria bacterium RIFCSPHIGHO2_01_FULL_39_12b]